MNADAVTRFALLAGFIFVSCRSVYLVSHTKAAARKIALWSMVPASLAWVWFYFHLVKTVPYIDGVLRTDIWFSRIAQFLTIVSTLVIQWVIGVSERVETASIGGQ